MPTVTLGFDPEVDEYENIRALIDGVYGVTETGPASPSATPPENGAQEVLPGGWTKRRMRGYIGYVKPNGRKALRTIAEMAPQASFDEVQKKMALYDDPNKYGGMMSTLGHAVNKTPGVTARPFDINYGTRTYSINEKVAALVIEVMDEMES